MKYKLYEDEVTREAEDLTAWINDLIQKNPGMYAAQPGPAMAMMAMCQLAWMRAMESHQRRMANSIEKLAELAGEER